MMYPFYNPTVGDGNPALLDTATGALSRAAFVLRLEEAAALAARLGHGVSVIVVDLAPLAGAQAPRRRTDADGVLGELVDRMWSLARRSDTVARVGADRLALLLPATHRRGAERLATRLEGLLAAPCATPFGPLIPDVAVRVIGAEPGQTLDAGDLLYALDSGSTSAALAV